MAQLAATEARPRHRATRQMVRLAALLATLAVTAGALFGGLVPATLRTGRVDPLDWLLPGLVALLVLILLLPDRATGRGAAFAWTLAALPPALFVVLAGASVPIQPLLALMAVLALSAGLMLSLAARPPLARWLALLLWIAMVAAGRVAIQRAENGGFAGKPAEALLMTALPLGADGAAKTSLFADFAAHSPLVAALAPAVTLRPVDHLDEGTLRGAATLLLAQPRQLRPAELVALDTWVREGGRAVILADPLLHWPDARSFADPRRAPFTSLLDPLFAHWGLALTPAEIGAGDPVQRRLLDNGALLQLAGASRFVASAGSPCTLAEQGLLADCRIGRGEARLVADADWLRDSLWTLDVAHPADARAWTSDAIPMLSHFLRRDSAGLAPAWTWLVDGERLVAGLRWALLLGFSIAFAGALFPRRLGAGSENSRAGPSPGRRSPDSS